MKPEFIQINGVKLAYYSKNDDQPQTIFFIHGNSVSSVVWRKQFADNLLSDFRLIALDLPAHGLSEASSNPQQDYSLPGLARIVAEAIPLLIQRSPFIVVSLSLGTNVTAELLALAVQPRGMVLAGPCVMGMHVSVSNIIKTGTHVYTVFTDEAPINEIAAYGREGSLSTDPADHDLFVWDYQCVKGPFRSILNRSLENEVYSDEIQLLVDSKIPQCVIMGADEQIVYPDYLDQAGLSLWGAQVHKIGGASHLVNIDRPDEFNRLLVAFADDVFR